MGGIFQLTSQEGEGTNFSFSIVTKEVSGGTILVGKSIEKEEKHDQL